jgi:hypothetical protein
MKRIILLVLILLAISPILAFDSSVARSRNGERGIELLIHNNSLAIRNYLIYYDRGLDLTSKITVGLSGSDTLPITVSCEQVNYTIYDSLPTQCTGVYNITYTSRNVTTTPNGTFNLVFEKNYLFNSDVFNDTNDTVTSNILSDILKQLNSTLVKYDTCTLERAQYQTSYSNCLDSKTKAGSFESNFTECSKQLTDCNNQLSTCQTQRQTTQTTVDTMTKEKEDTKNTPYLFGIGGLIIGIVGAMLYNGKWGKDKARNPDGNYNRTQSG